MEIIWQETALNDFEAIRVYIAQNNTAAADSVRAAILEQSAVLHSTLISAVPDA